MTTLKFSLKQPKKVKAVKTPDFGEELSSTVIHEEPDEVNKRVTVREVARLQLKLIAVQVAGLNAQIAEQMHWIVVQVSELHQTTWAKDLISGYVSKKRGPKAARDLVLDEYVAIRPLLDLETCKTGGTGAAAPVCIFLPLSGNDFFRMSFGIISVCLGNDKLIMALRSGIQAAADGRDFDRPSELTVTTDRSAVMRERLAPIKEALEKDAKARSTTLTYAYETMPTVIAISIYNEKDVFALPDVSPPSPSMAGKAPSTAPPKPAPASKPAAAVRKTASSSAPPANHAPTPSTSKRTIEEQQDFSFSPRHKLTDNDSPSPKRKKSNEKIESSPGRRFRTSPRKGVAQVLFKGRGNA